MMKARKYVIEFVDLLTGSITDDLTFERDSELELCDIISPGDSEIFPNAIYDISLEELIAIHQTLGVAINFNNVGKSRVSLRLARAGDLLPYKLHTNRELTLMLCGSKPMSMFVESLPHDEGLELIPERYFERYVLSGEFVRREHVELDELSHRTRVVYFSTKAEEWRIDAHILIRKTAAKVGWNETFERLEGSLLGYEEWQNDFHISSIYGPPR